MSLRFRYQLAPTGRMIHSLGGRTVRPRPLVPVRLISASSSPTRAGLLDKGADETIYPEARARLLGLDLTNAPLGSATVANSASINFRYSPVTLYLTEGNETRGWKAIVGFSPARLRYGLLGFAGCLQYFTASFRGDIEEVELSVNALYPGT